MAKPSVTRHPEERSETLRRALMRCLISGPLTAREISSRIGVPEKDVGGHLEHLARTLRRSDRALRLEPARCLACDFAFDRRPFRRPSRCPRCRGERIDPATYWIEGTSIEG